MKEKIYLYWLIGFFDAEASFQIYKKPYKNKFNQITSISVGYAIQICLHLRDLELLKEIKQFLGERGKIYTYEHKNEAIYSINKKEELLWVIDNMFKGEEEIFLTKYQFSRFSILKEGVKNNITNFKNLNDFENFINKISLPKTSNFNEIFLNYWLIGFLNGEISFTFATKTNSSIPVISLEHTDENCMILIKNFFDIKQKLYVRQRDTRKITYRLYISSKIDLNNIVQFLDKYNSLKGYKLIQYNEWKLKYKLN